MPSTPISRSAATRAASSTVQAISSIPSSLVTATSRGVATPVEDPDRRGADLRDRGGGRSREAAAHQLQRREDGRAGSRPAVPGTGDQRIGPAEAQAGLELAGSRRGSATYIVETIARSIRPWSRSASTSSASRPASFRSQSISTRSSGGSRERVERLVERQARPGLGVRPVVGDDERRAAVGRAGRARRRGAAGRRTRSCRRRPRPPARSWRSCCPRRGRPLPCGRPGAGRSPPGARSLPLAPARFGPLAPAGIGEGKLLLGGVGATRGDPRAPGRASRAARRRGRGGSRRRRRARRRRSDPPPSAAMAAMP